MKKLLPMLSVLAAAFPQYATASESARFDTFAFKAADGIERPYIVYTPAGLKPGEKRPLLIHLHGAIGRAEVSKNPMGSVKKSSFLKLAESGRYYVLFPFGQKTAGWFDQTGNDMVLGQLEKVLADFPGTDRDRVFLSGFSDGGSGTLYMASVRPDAFAGFISLNGSLPVAAHLGEHPLYPENFARKPLYLINTQNDSLYPARMMGPIVETLKRYNTMLTVSLPEGEHNMQYLPAEIPALNNFISQHRRQTAFSLSWEGSAGSGTEWLTIDRLRPQEAARSWHQSYRLEMFNDKASLDIQFDPAHYPQLKVAGLGKTDGTARKMGVQIGDTVVKMDDMAMENPYSPYTFLSRKKAGEAVSLTVVRNGQTIVLNGRFKPGYSYQVFEKQADSGKILAEIKQGRLHVQTSKVASFTIDFDKLPDAAALHTLTINGTSRPLPQILQGKHSFTAD